MMSQEIEASRQNVLNPLKNAIKDVIKKMDEMIYLDRDRFWIWEKGTRKENYFTDPTENYSSLNAKIPLNWLTWRKFSLEWGESGRMFLKNGIDEKLRSGFSKCNKEGSFRIVW